MDNSGSRPSLVGDLSEGLRLITPLIVIATTVIVPLSPTWKFIVISAVLWGLCYYLRYRRDKPTIVGSNTGSFIYREQVRFGALIGLIGIPSLAIGLWASPLILVHKALSPPVATPLPPHHIIDEMDVLNWNPGFCNDLCGASNGSSSMSVGLIPGKRNEAVEILYFLNNEGWVQITKDIDPKILDGTNGISFFYKGSGTSNTVELKIILEDETTYGAAWNKVTNTNGRWVLLEARYGINIRCWWLMDQCRQHGNSPVLTAVKRIEIAISHQDGDTGGLGKVAFDDLAGIP